MDDKASIAAALRDADGSARCRFLASLERKDIDHDIFKLIAKMAMEDESIQVRLAAVRKIEPFWPDPDVVRVCRALAVDPEIQVADAAVGLLSRAGDARARQVLLDAYLKASHFGYKWLVFEALTTGWKYRDVESIILGYMLADSDEVIRASTVAYLGRQRDPSLADDLVQLLADSDARVRANALEALGAFKASVDRSVFERMLKDPNHRVQCTAIDILYDLGGVAVDDQIEPLLRHRDELFRASAAYLLRKNQAIPNRKAYLEELARDRSPVVQRQLALLRG
jgi:HEAT repeat protein